MNRASSLCLVGGLFYGLWGTAPGLSQVTEHQYLSGHGKDDAVPWKFQCTTGAQSGYWTNLPVPSHWDMHGFGSLNYKKDATNAWDERGLYEREFTVPTRWTGQRIFLVFDGVMTDTSASLNGESIGPRHEGGFYRFKYEVTGLIRRGATNRLEVTVAKHSANPSVNNAERLADYWVFGGIYRPVYLEAVPSQFIERVAIDARADGVFAMDVFVNGIAPSGTLEAQIFDRNGTPIGAVFRKNLTGIKTTLQTRVAAPRTWTAETPYLYRVEVRLKQGDQMVHRYPQRFGFRTMEVREGDGLYVNGRRVILKGVNRHSFWPDSGRCLSEAVHRMDIEAIKDMNMNAVRMSHYPPDEAFLDLCDELGLYVLDELGGWHKAYDTEAGRKLVAEMVTRDVNHPSILFWDNGNEGGGNTNLDRVFLEFDPQQRRVLHPWSPFSGVNTAHYLAYENARIASDGLPMFYHDGKESVDTSDPKKYIYLPTEFLHGLFDGGLGAGLADYWKMMQNSPVLGGGFLWVLCDDGVKRPDTGEIDVAGNQAPDGIVGPYREREGSFYAIKEIWSPIVVTRETNGHFAVENHYSFTDANQCRFTWQLRKFRRPDETASGFTVIAEGTALSPSIPPGGKGTLKLGLPDTYMVADALALRVTDPTGRELWTWDWPASREYGFRELVTTASAPAPTATETADAIEVKAGDLAVRFSKQNGQIMGARRENQKFSLANGPCLAVGSAILSSIEQKRDNSGIVVTATYTGELKSVTWRVRGDGWVQCDYKFTASGTQDYFGVVFDYPERLVKHKRWLGDGPYRVWKNRLHGGTFNVWENDYNNTITGWSGWKYPEFKGCFAQVRWLQLDTTEGIITFVPDAGIPFVQVLTPEQPPTHLVGNTRVSLPQAGLGFLHGIPPIGSKFKAAETTGPQGQPNMATGQYAGSVGFYFGKVP
jgi:hypothetical protein